MYVITEARSTSFLIISKRSSRASMYSFALGATGGEVRAVVQPCQTPSAHPRAKEYMEALEEHLEIIRKEVDRDRWGGESCCAALPNTICRGV
jgi:hypothetical protein